MNKDEEKSENLIHDTESEIAINKKYSNEVERGKIKKSISLQDEQIEEDNDIDDLKQKRKKTLSHRKISVIKAVLEMKKTNDWEKFIQTFNKKMDKNQTIKEIMKNIFNMKSYFITIWKTSFAFFNVVVIFVYFFYYVFLKLAQEDPEHLPTKVYFFINTMFGFEFCISVLILIFNGGSWLSYLKLPLKFVMLIPFTLQYSNLIYLLLKFARIDRIERLFTFVEQFCNSIINTFVHNYYLKVFMTYLNQLFRYLLIFGLYAHFFACIYAFYTQKYYIESLYYTFETFTTIGYGDPNPSTNTARILIIINMFVGVNIFYVITAIIKMIYLKIYGYRRESSFRKHFEFFLYKLQKNTKRVFPDKLKEMVSSYLIFRQGLCFKDLMTKYEDEFKMCRYDVKQEIRQKVFGYLKEQYQIFFKDCSDEFIYRIFENLKPKM